MLIAACYQYHLALYTTDEKYGDVVEILTKKRKQIGDQFNG